MTSTHVLKRSCLPFLILLVFTIGVCSQVYAQIVNIDASVNGDPRNGVTQLFTNTDPIGWVLDQPLDHTPGTTFFYNSGTTNVLAAIVEVSSGMRFYDFLNSFLFFPIGIMDEDYLIEVFPSGYSFASGGLYMNSRHLLKIGYIFLNGGKWGTEQIISTNQ